VLALAILTVTLVLPPLFPFFWKLDPLCAALVSVTLVPQALPLSLPAGLCVGVLWAMRGKAVTWRRLSTVLSIAIALAAVVWMVLEWMMPQGNQGFRELMAVRLAVDGHVPRLTPGLNELGLSRLGQRSDPAAIHHYHVLWALCFAAVPLSLLACGLAGYVRRSAPAIALAVGLSILYAEWMRVWAEIPSEPRVLPFMQAWVPNIVLLLLACALIWKGPRHGHGPAV
jgi:lipopolysaccharide export LptBFGC system permease protein LptF